MVLPQGGVRRWMVAVATILSLSPLVGCNSSKKQESGKQYALKGKVVSIDKPKLSMVVDGEAIPGLMDAMAMPYQVKSPGELDALAVGDVITATVVMNRDDYFVQDIKIVQHAAPPAGGTETAALHVPEVGEAVPDFQLVNQNGKRISLDQYRGKTLLVTFIYTRCPFADFCPRVSGEFAEVNRRLKGDPSLYEKTHLLSISFDPEHDTPKVLRSYGAGYLEKRAPSFAHWEFAAAPQTDLPEIARYFGVTYKEDSGLITHTLSTAVIGPDGRIFKWYHGSDWKAEDLLKDVGEVSHASGLTTAQKNF